MVIVYLALFWIIVGVIGTAKHNTLRRIMSKNTSVYGVHSYDELRGIIKMEMRVRAVPGEKTVVSTCGMMV